jgi:hypothetical protein
MTMKNTLKNSLILSVLLLMASMSFGQTILTQTTLSAAVTTSNTTTISLTSATGVTANNTALFVADGVVGEAMFVNSVNGTTIGVTRGYQNLGKARPHAKSAAVFVVPMSGGYPSAINTIVPSGSCTRTSIPYLPVISLGTTGMITMISDCLGGVWVAGEVMAQGGVTPALQIRSPLPGAVTAGAVWGTNSTVVANELYCTELDIPVNKKITGLAFHVGTTGGTDKWIGALYDSGGNLIANSTTTSGSITVVTSAYGWDVHAFTTPYYAIGPEQYFGCVYSNGTTATLDTVTTGYADYVITYKG